MVDIQKKNILLNKRAIYDLFTTKGFYCQKSAKFFVKSLLSQISLITFPSIIKVTVYFLFVQIINNNIVNIIKIVDKIIRKMVK